MEISKSFVVNAPAAAAWEFLTEPARVVRCLPGAALGEQVDEHSHAGTISIKVGPVQASYRGTMRFERLDRDALTAEISAQGQETRGRGGAKMTMTSRLVEITPSETEIHVTSDVQVMGVLAQFGRGMIQDVSDQLFQKFVDCARATLESPAPAEAAPATPVPATIPIADAGPPIDPGSPVPSAAAAVPLAAASAVPAATLPVAGEPIDALSLGGAALGRAAGRAARRPVVWVAALAIVLVVVWLFRR
ncbi:MAG TPA: SRPBCC family protein [Longimicrobium sp.]